MRALLISDPSCSYGSTYLALILAVAMAVLT
jgi:hypothetical protein